MPGLTRSDYQQARCTRENLRRREAERDAFEERAAIIEEGAHVDRRTAERWARECLRRVKGAV